MRAVPPLRCFRQSGSRINRHITSPDGPNDPSELVRDRDRRFVMPASRLHGQRPLVQSGQRLLGDTATMSGVQHRAGTVRE